MKQIRRPAGGPARHGTAARGCVRRACRRLPAGRWAHQ